MKLRNSLYVVFLSLLIICSSTINSFSKEFIDIPDDYWAKGIINNISEKNIIVGYADGSFKPERKVKKIEALIVLSRVLGVDLDKNKEVVLEAEVEYFDDLVGYDTYATRELSFLLKKGILESDELSLYLSNGNADKNMTRQEIVPLLVRVLNMEEELSSKKLVILSYKDAELIPRELRAFVQYLSQQNIMGSATDNNEFLPNSAITRVQIAEIALNIANNIEKDSLGDNDSYNVEEVNTGEVLEVNQGVINSNENITLHGFIDKIDTTDNKVFAKIDSKIKEYKLKDDALIIIDGGVKGINQVKEGYRAILQIKNGEIEFLTLFSDNKTNDQLNDNSEQENNKIFDENNNENDVEDTNRKTNIIGIIYEILISNQPKLTIINFEGNLETYDIIQEVKINLFNKESSIYDLRLDNRVDLKTNNNQVEEINVYSQVNGNISIIDFKNNEIVIENLQKSYKIVKDNNTIFKTISFNDRISFEDLELEDYILVIGSIVDSKIYAKEITVLDL